MTPNAASAFYSAIYNLTFVTDATLRDRMYEELLLTQQGLREHFQQERLAAPQGRPRKSRGAAVADAVAEDRRV